MALADGGARLAIGTALQFWEFRDILSVARRLESAAGRDRLSLLTRRRYLFTRGRGCNPDWSGSLPR
jgi:hypothetical protein